MFRVAFLLAMMIALPLAASAQNKPEPITLHVGVIPAEVAAEVFYAVDMGFFKKSGLNVQFQVFNNGAAIAAAIAGGSLDIGLSDLISVISAHSRGLSFVYVAPGLTASIKDPTMGLIVPATSTLFDGRDFNGKSIAVGGLRNIAEIAADSWLDGNGGDSKSVKFLEVPFPALLPALSQGRIQAAFANEPWLTLALDAGYRVIWLDKNPLAPTFLQSGWLTSREWLEKNPEGAAKFAAVIRETAQWANSHPALVAPILSKYTNIPLSVAQRMHKGEFSERFDAALVQPAIDASVKYGIIPKSFPAQEIFSIAK